MRRGSLGGRAAYIGKVSDDDLGRVFGHDLNAVGVAFRPGAPSDDTPTGRCIIVVTPDAQRTMSTYLGVSSLLSADDLDEETIAAGAVLYMEGYLFDRDDAKKAFRRAAGIAHANGRKVSLTLSDSFCVDRHRRDFAALVRDEVDVLFGNAEELRIAVRGRTRWTTPSRWCGGRVRAGRHHRWQGRLVRRDAEDDVVHVPAEPVARSSTPPAPATCTRPGSSSVTRGSRPLDRVRPARVDRRWRGDQPCRPAPARRAAHAAAVTAVDDLAEVRATATAWLAAEPDEDIRAELQALLDGPEDELAARFGGQLTFGTAGLRAAVGAGPLRMNRLVVRQAAAGLAAYVLAGVRRRGGTGDRDRLRRPAQERRVRHWTRRGSSPPPGLRASAAAVGVADAGPGVGADRPRRAPPA